jgi:hypothetical protein
LSLFLLAPASFSISGVRVAALLAIAALAVACNSRSRQASPKPSVVAMPDGRKLYGQALARAEPISVAALLARPDGHTRGTVTVEGSVRKACTRKGCWMELAQSQQEGTPGCRVTFKNYGFFVPTNAAGSRARVQGVVEIDTLPASSVRHYEEEGAVFAAKGPDGTAQEVRLVATGVELWR